MEDWNRARLEGIIEDIFIKVSMFIIIVDFIVLDYDADDRVPIILGL